MCINSRRFCFRLKNVQYWLNRCNTGPSDRFNTRYIIPIPTVDIRYCTEYCPLQPRFFLIKETKKCAKVNNFFKFTSLALEAIEIAPVSILSPVGTIALPFNTLCRTPVLNYLFCYVCNQDCIYDHNTYGGRCDPNPHNPDECVCICSNTIEDAKERNITASSQDTCTNYIGYIPLPSFVGDEDGLAIQTRFTKCV